MLLPGHVIRLRDSLTRPPQTKRHICICPERRLFLRINTEDHWHPSHTLDYAANSAFLDYTSFVELRQLCRFSIRELQAALARPENPLGRLTQPEALALAWSARRAETLRDEFQLLTWERLTQDWH
jgi:hypothetical protein